MDSKSGLKTHLLADEDVDQGGGCCPCLFGGSKSNVPMAQTSDAIPRTPTNGPRKQKMGSQVGQAANLSVEVASAETRQTPDGKVTMYTIRVKWLGKLMWTIDRRYNEFRDLHEKLSQANRPFPIPDLPPMPAKQVFGRFDATFIARRRVQLDSFLRILSRKDLVFLDEDFRAFLSVGKTPIDPSGASFNPLLRVDDFKLLAVVGKGSYGKVVKVKKKDTGKIYAMKILQKHRLVEKKAVAHTITERKVLENIDHPFIVSLRYAFQTNTKLYLVLDYFKGGELFFHLKKEGRFSEDRARFYLAEVVMAVQCLHEHGIIYRDLKPENILVDEDGHIRLTDFGLSKDSIKGSMLTNTFCGTPHYAAPEMIDRKGPDRGRHGKSIDWWSSGTLLYEMLTGNLPFYHRNLRKMYDNILHARLEFPSYLSDEAKSLLSGMLDRNPRTRLGHNNPKAIMSHPFFDPIDWDKLYRKEIPPPFKPTVGGEDADYNVSKKLLKKTPKDSPIEPSELEGKLDENGALAFPDFSYTREQHTLQADVQTEDLRDDFGRSTVDRGLYDVADSSQG